MGRKIINPPRRRTKEQERMDYRKQLATRQVTSTADTTPKPQLDKDPNSTDKMQSVEKTTIPAKRLSPSSKNFVKQLSIIGSIIVILGFIGAVAYKYASLNEGLNYVKASLTELKQNLDKRIDRLEERIDKYISKEKSK